MACNSCGQNGCYTNPCNRCQTPADRDCDLSLDYVPHTNCTISLTNGECSSLLDLCPAIKECQTVTHMNWNDQTGCIVYENEKYIYTDGMEGGQEIICVSDFYPFINVCNLNDVWCDDELPGNCYELIYRKSTDCSGCKSKDDHWEYFNHNYPGAKVDSLPYIKGEDEDGCPAYIDKPENCSFLIFSPSCERPTGEWQPWKIPEAGEEILAPEEDGYYRVLTLDDCGCPKEIRQPIVPPEMATFDYPRDSMPDDPDFPWYYGCYNDKINLHLQENFPRYFGKYDLKVTINYGVQAIKADGFNFNYNWRSILAPVVEGQNERHQVEHAGSILQTWAMSATSPQIPWGTSSLRGSFAFIVPKGKEAYLYHEFRVRTIENFPNYRLNSQYDGKRVPEIEATLNSARWPASRLNALQVIVEPTQGQANYQPVKDAERGQLDAPTDVSPQAF